MKKILIALCAGVLVQTAQPPLPVTLPVSVAAGAETAGPEIAAPSALLMEASTGQVIYEKDRKSVV